MKPGGNWIVFGPHVAPALAQCDTSLSVPMGLLVCFFFGCFYFPVVELDMVQLSPFLALDVAPLPDNSAEGGGRALGLADDDDDDDARSEKETSAVGLSLETTAAYQGYETYIEDGLICLKHKVRNLEKKKVGPLKGGKSVYRSRCDTSWTTSVLCRLQLKLEDYKKRLSKGEVLNKDQMVRPGCSGVVYMIRRYTPYIH